MKKSFLNAILRIFCGLMTSSSAFAQLQTTPQKVFQYEVVEFRPLKDHHFELQATQNCMKGVIVESRRDLISCQFQETGEARVELSVCDDKKTFCRSNRFSVLVQKPPQGKKMPAPQEGLLRMKEELHQELLSGFQSLTVAQARHEAEKERKPVFLMISTDWCPPCNQAKEYLLSTPSFQEFTRHFIKVYVDGDSKSSMKYDRVVPFFEYPTFALLNSDFQEVSRFTGELAMEEFTQWWSRSAPFLLEGYEEVKERVEERKRDSWLRSALDFVLFRSAYTKERELHFVIEAALAKDDKDFLALTDFTDVPDFLKERWLSAREQALVPQVFSKEEFLRKELEFSGLTPYFVYHLREACALKLPECETLKKELPGRPEKILSRLTRTRAENLGAAADEYYAQMEFYREFKDQKQRLAQAKNCVDAFEKLIPLSHLKFPRYAMQGILACAGEFDLGRVTKIYRNLMKQYPDDPTFILRYARHLKDDVKDLKQAKVWSEKAMDASYGFNWFYAASLNVQINQALGLKKEARKVIDQAFARLQLGPDKDSRNQKVLSRFRSLEKNLDR